MDKLVLFCKTYSGDLERFKILKDSVDKFNKDKLPFYLSVPKSDLELFRKIWHNAPYKFEILTDESIIGGADDVQNWVTQQVVKMKFYKLNLAEFYLIVDSDSYFIRDFYKSDFMYDENTPYIVCYENKYFKELASLLGDKNVFDIHQKIRDFLGSKGKTFFFWNNPLFSSKVLAELEKNVDTIENLIAKYPLEYVWHAEFLLKSRCINFIPVDSFFRNFYYEAEYKLWQSQGENLSDIKKYYVGILMQNRWCKSKIYKETLKQKFNRRLKRLAFYIGTDRAHLKKDFIYYKMLVLGFFRLLFKGES